MEIEPNKKFLTLEEIAEVMGVNYQLIYKLVRTGELRSVKVGRVYRVSQADFSAWLEQSRTHDPLTCASCGTRYRSADSLNHACTQTGKKICFDCWERRGIRQIDEGEKP